MIRQIINTFVYGSIWVALCATALAWLTLFEDGIVVGVEDALLAEWKVLVFVFCSTLIIYNLNMASGLAALRKQGTESVRHHWCLDNERILQLFVGLGVLGSGISFLLMSKEVWMLLAPFAFLSLAYVLPIIGRKGTKTKLREFGLNKIFSIAVVWAVVTVFIPLVNANGLIVLYYADYWMMALERALFIFAITLPFDVRDIKNDRKINVKTIPILIGVKKTVGLAATLLLIYIGLNWFRGSQMMIGHLIGAVLTAILVLRTNENRTDMFYSFTLEGTMMILAASVYAAAILV